MNTIDGIPLLWDAEGDKAMPGGVFPQGIASPSLVTVKTGLPFKSAFGESPFGANWEGINIAEYDGSDWKERTPRHELLYSIFINTDGQQLIRWYKTDNLLEQKYGGWHDGELDLVIYYELPNAFDTQGSVCLIKMSYGVAGLMANPEKGEVNRSNIIDNVLNDQMKKGIQLNRARIEDAISLMFRDTSGYAGLMAKIGAELLRGIAKLIRMLELSEKRWNPLSPNYSPLIPINLVDKMLDGWNSFKNGSNRFFKGAQQAAKWCGKYIWLIGDILESFINTIVSIFSAVIEAIDFVMQLLASVSHILKLVNAFICGVLNEILELLAMIFELTAYIITLTDRVEYMLFRETIENIIEDYLKDPGKIVRQIKEGFQALKKKYEKASSEYEVAYQSWW